MTYSCVVLLLLMMLVTNSQITKVPTAAPTIPGQLKPFLTCWFFTYRDQNRYRNVIMGYSSTFAGTVMRREGVCELITNPGAVANIDVSGLTSFPPGRNASLFYVNDVASIQWRLNETVLFINVNELERDTMCVTAFNGVCRPDDGGEVSHFCEDASFCNGEERCVDQVCLPSVNVVSCTDDQHCNEEPPRCDAGPNVGTTMAPPPPDAGDTTLFVLTIVTVGVIAVVFLLIYACCGGEQVKKPVTSVRTRRAKS